MMQADSFSRFDEEEDEDEDGEKGELFDTDEIDFSNSNLSMCSLKGKWKTNRLYSIGEKIGIHNKKFKRDS